MPDQEVPYPAALPATIRILRRIGRVVADMPKVLPTLQNPTVRPLKIGVATDLHSRIALPEGMRRGKANGLVSDALRIYAASPEYLNALALPGAWRFDLDGNPVEPVSAGHADYARAILADLVASQSPEKEIIAMLIPALKVSLPLRPDQLPPADDTVKTVEIRLDLGDGKPFTVAFSGKNYRKALRQVQELQGTGAEVIVIMQGRLIAGHKVEGAGLSVTAKTPKLEA